MVPVKSCFINVLTIPILNFPFFLQKPMKKPTISHLLCQVAIKRYAFCVLCGLNAGDASRGWIRAVYAAPF